MNTATKELLDHLSLGVPLYYSAAIYGLFFYLDKQASSSAKKTISSWLRSETPSREDTSAAILNIFDRIYSYPLWTPKALFRSIIISLAVTFIVVYHFHYATLIIILYPCCGMTTQLTMQISANLIADYISLYAIRYCISINKSPVFTLLIGTIVGFFVIIIIYTIQSVLRFSLETSSFSVVYFFQGFKWWAFNIFEFVKTYRLTSTRSILLGAFAVHFWLILLAFGILISRFLNYFKSASVLMQWFLKKGDKQPLVAIGYIASSITFILLTISRLGSG